MLDHQTLKKLSEMIVTGDSDALSLTGKQPSEWVAWESGTVYDAVLLWLTRIIVGNSTDAGGRASRSCLLRLPMSGFRSPSLACRVVSGFGQQHGWKREKWPGSHLQQVLGESVDLPPAITRHALGGLAFRCWIAAIEQQLLLDVSAAPRSAAA